MSYPASGIALSTGSAWGTSIVNNSANWNTAYGWGNHASAGYALSSALSGYVPTSRTINSRDLTSNISITASDVGLGNVTNESKATMFTSPTFTGVVIKHNTDTLASQAYARAVGGGEGSMVYPGAGVSVSTGYTWGTSLSTTGTGNVVLSASPTLSGTVALGTGSLTMTGSLAATGSRVLKGWFTDLEVTNLPTVNGGTLKTALSLTSSDVGLGNVTNESKATMFTNPDFTGTRVRLGTDSLATKAYARSVGGGIGGGISPSDTSIMLAPYTKHYSDTMSVSAGVLRTKATTITTEPYSVQIFSSGGKDITHAVSDSVALNGGVYKLYVYSVDALTGAKIKILY
jgi:hypothetical protein